MSHGWVSEIEFRVFHTAGLKILSLKATTQLMTNVFTFLFRATRKAFSAPAEAFLLARMAVWVVLLSAAVKGMSLPHALRLVSTKIRRPRDTPAGEIQEQLADAIDRLLNADLFMLQPICWKRAALLHRYLALNGISSKIIFGVRRELNGSIGGHAWLEVSGTPILESTAPNYAVTYTFPSNQTSEVDLNIITEQVS